MRKSLLITLAIVVLAIWVAGMIYNARRVRVTVDVASVEKDISDHLPTGASRADVESYLDKRGIQHSYIAQSIGAPEYDRTESAMIRGASGTSLVRGDIQILFKFDDQDKLIHYSTREIFTGP
jgi:hypothetical protein